MTILEACTQDLERAQAELKIADEKFCEFRREHMATIDGVTVLLGSEVTDGINLGRKYYARLKALDHAQRVVQDKMAAWARAKSEAA